jgi:hypothetical protein
MRNSNDASIEAKVALTIAERFRCRVTGSNIIIWTKDGT